MDKIRSVLFVCTGNSCRSVMAEGLLKKYLKEAGKGYIQVRSAGIRPLVGSPPTDETIEVMRDEGIDVTSVRSKELTDDLIKNADLILVMEDLHKMEVKRMVPEAISKTYLLKEFGKAGDDKEKTPEEGFGIPDPISRPLEFYKYSFNILKKEIERIVKLL